jgi:dynein heavy chain
LNKCFEGIDKLEFKQDKKILGMHSSMGEYIEFIKAIDPFNRETNEVRNIEDWLGEVEVQMRDSLRDLVKRSGADYSDDTRKEWVFKWPAQIVLTMDQVFWT